MRFGNLFDPKRLETYRQQVVRENAQLSAEGSPGYAQVRRKAALDGIGQAEVAIQNLPNSTSLDGLMHERSYRDLLVALLAALTKTLPDEVYLLVGDNEFHRNCNYSLVCLWHGDDASFGVRYFSRQEGAVFALRPNVPAFRGTQSNAQALIAADLLTPCRIGLDGGMNRGFPVNITWVHSENFSDLRQSRDFGSWFLNQITCALQDDASVNDGFLVIPSALMSLEGAQAEGSSLNVHLDLYRSLGSFADPMYWIKRDPTKRT